MSTNARKVFRNIFFFISWIVDAVRIMRKRRQKQKEQQHENNKTT